MIVAIETQSSIWSWLTRLCANSPAGTMWHLYKSSRPCLYCPSAFWYVRAQVPSQFSMARKASDVSAAVIVVVSLSLDSAEHIMNEHTNKSTTKPHPIAILVVDPLAVDKAARWNAILCTCWSLPLLMLAGGCATLEWVSEPLSIGMLNNGRDVIVPGGKNSDCSIMVSSVKATAAVCLISIGSETTLPTSSKHARRPLPRKPIALSTNAGLKTKVTYVIAGTGSTLEMEGHDSGTSRRGPHLS